MILTEQTITRKSAMGLPGPRCGQAQGSALPLDKQTFSDPLGMSQRCQKQKFLSRVFKSPGGGGHSRPRNGIIARAGELDQIQAIPKWVCHVRNATVFANLNFAINPKAINRETVASISDTTKSR
jgi:hypothetical protein